MLEFTNLKSNIYNLSSNIGGNINMALTKQEWLALEAKAHQLRLDLLETTNMAGSGHIGGSSSVMDILVILYYKYMNLKVEDPNWEDRDRCILSKGHAGIGYAPLLVDKGWNDAEQLKTFNLTGSKMGIHLDSNKVVGVDASTGSLGHGLSIAVGTALAARVTGKSYKTYCILGDGELDEGSNWEAAMSAANFKLGVHNKVFGTGRSLVVFFLRRVFIPRDFRFHIECLFIYRDGFRAVPVK